MLVDAAGLAMIMVIDLKLTMMLGTGRHGPLMVITLNNKMNVCRGAKNGDGDADEGDDDKIAKTLAMDAVMIADLIMIC